ncbi:hypothetical protein [Bacteroides sp. 224]|uniref:hypothetical protein n=1 Tax=Bacteroides sp. 224 TaxID=2302936 RepID=UPI0013D880CF|nr:hypothetical protein [Bacteroides sp. 224]
MVNRIIVCVLFSCYTIHIYPQILTESNLRNRANEIRTNVESDLKKHFNNQMLLIHPVPVCDMIVDSCQKIVLSLDTITGYAVLQSNEQTIGYAYKYTTEDHYSLRKIVQDSTIYIGGDLMRLLDVALRFNPGPFRINTFSKENTTIFGKTVFVGFGFFKNEKLRFIGFSESVPVLFDSIDDFFSFRFQSIENYLEQKRNYKMNNEIKLKKRKNRKRKH